jgi:hypothetical protein
VSVVRDPVPEHSILQAPRTSVMLKGRLQGPFEQENQVRCDASMGTRVRLSKDFPPRFDAAAFNRTVEK